MKRPQNSRLDDFARLQKVSPKVHAGFAVLRRAQFFHDGCTRNRFHQSISFLAKTFELGKLVCRGGPLSAKGLGKLLSLFNGSLIFGESGQIAEILRIRREYLLGPFRQ